MVWLSTSHMITLLSRQESRLFRVEAPTVWMTGKSYYSNPLPPLVAASVSARTSSSARRQIYKMIDLQVNSRGQFAYAGRPPKSTLTVAAWWQFQGYGGRGMWQCSA